jgi:hypothetical protein
MAGNLKVWRRAYATEDDLARDGIAFIREAWARSAASPAAGGAAS